LRPRIGVSERQRIGNEPSGTAGTVLGYEAVIRVRQGARQTVAEFSERKRYIATIERQLHFVAASMFLLVLDEPVRKAAFISDVFVCRENLVKFGGLPVSVRRLNNGISEGAFVSTAPQRY
jgi:hypothetical protein